MKFSIFSKRIVSIILCASMAVGALGTQNVVYADEPVTEDAANDNTLTDWMSTMPNCAPLDQLNIPGTHDSGTGRYSTIGTYIGQCQDWTIAEQLNHGMRVFDIRLTAVGAKDSDRKVRKETYYTREFSRRDGPESLKLAHGPLDCYIDDDHRDGEENSLHFVLADCSGFLEKHPDETIVLMMDDENGAGKDAEFRKCMKKAREFFSTNTYYEDQSMYSNKVSKVDPSRFVFFNDPKDNPKSGGKSVTQQPKIPRLGDVRGKIIIVERVNMSRTEAEEKTKERYIYGITKEYEDSCSQSKSKKWNLLKAQLDSRPGQDYTKESIWGRDVEEVRSWIGYSNCNTFGTGSSVAFYVGMILAAIGNPLGAIAWAIAAAANDNPAQAANYIIPRLREYNWKKGVNYGWILMDYPTDDVTKKIINSNVNLKECQFDVDKKSDKIDIETCAEVSLYKSVDNEQTWTKVEGATYNAHKAKVNSYWFGSLPANEKVGGKLVDVKYKIEAEPKGNKYVVDTKINPGYPMYSWSKESDEPYYSYCGGKGVPGMGSAYDINLDSKDYYVKVRWNDLPGKHSIDPDKAGFIFTLKKGNYEQRLFATPEEKSWDEATMTETIAFEEVKRVIENGYKIVNLEFSYKDSQYEYDGGVDTKRVDEGSPYGDVYVYTLNRKGITKVNIAFAGDEDVKDKYRPKSDDSHFLNSFIMEAVDERITKYFGVTGELFSAGEYHFTTDTLYGYVEGATGAGGEVKYNMTYPEADHYISQMSSSQVEPLLNEVNITYNLAPERKFNIKWFDDDGYESRRPEEVELVVRTKRQQPGDIVREYKVKIERDLSGDWTASEYLDPSKEYEYSLPDLYYYDTEISEDAATNTVTIKCSYQRKVGIEGNLYWYGCSEKPSAYVAYNVDPGDGDWLEITDDKFSRVVSEDEDDFALSVKTDDSVADDYECKLFVAASKNEGEDPDFNIVYDYNFIKLIDIDGNVSWDSPGMPLWAPDTVIRLCRSYEEDGIIYEETVDTVRLKDGAFDFGKQPSVKLIDTAEACPYEYYLEVEEARNVYTEVLPPVADEDSISFSVINTVNQGLIAIPVPVTINVDSNEYYDEAKTMPVHPDKEFQLSISQDSELADAVTVIIEDGDSLCNIAFILEIDEPGTYYFEVDEKSGTSGDGWDYGVDDTLEHNVTVTVTENEEDGDFEYYVSPDSILINNKFTVQPYILDVNIDNSIYIFTDYPEESEEYIKMKQEADNQVFIFNLETEEEDIMIEEPTVKIVGEGTGIDRIMFTKPGQFDFTVNEMSINMPNWIMADDSSETTVVIDWDDAGRLTSVDDVANDNALRIGFWNMYMDNQVPITGDIYWADDDDESGRPKSIKVQLYRRYADEDEGTVIKTLTVKPDKQKNWIYDFGSYPKYDDEGEEIDYWVAQKSVPKGYESYCGSYLMIFNVKIDFDGNSNKLNSKLKLTSSKNVAIEWGKVDDADAYEIYMNYCGANNKPVLVKTVKAGKTKATVKTLNKKAIDPKRCVKVCVVAVKMIDGKKVRIGKSIMAHVAGKNVAKYTNAKKVTVKKNAVSVKKGKSFTVKASTVNVNPKKKILSHAGTFRYASSNKKVAKVDENGKVKALSKGNCYIYVYALNGCSKKIKVTVK